MEAALEHVQWLFHNLRWLSFYCSKGYSLCCCLSFLTKSFVFPGSPRPPQNTVQFEYLYNSALWLQGQRLFSLLVSILLFTSFLKNHEKFSYTTFIYRRLFRIRVIQLSTTHETKLLLSSPTSPSAFPSSSSTSAQLSILKGLILFQMEWLSNKP